MNQFLKKTIAVFSAGILSLTPVLSVSAREYTDEEKDFYAYYINTVVELMESEYKFDFPKDDVYQKIITRLMMENPELLEQLIKIAASSLDENTMYFSRDELQGFMESTTSSYTGIGISIERAKGYVEITGITPDSPSQKAGLLPGDLIISIDGEDASSFDIGDVRDRIRGEVGSSVTLGIRRGEEEHSINVVRATVGASPVKYSITDDKIGYLQLTRFNDLAVDGVKEALKGFSENNVSDFVIDLRNNPGGTLNSVIQILEMFVPKDKVIVNVDFKDDRRDQLIKSTASFTKPKYNMVVLINGDTASAAEVFTGSILDNKLGVVVGEQSYGKATIQEFMGLRSYDDMNLGDVKITTGEYQTPNGNNIHHLGIAPHLRVKNSQTPFDESGFVPFEFDQKYEKGDTGAGVLAIKQRLDALGYEVGEVDETYDDELAVAVTTFQKNTGLYPYGVMDFTTQTVLANGIRNYKITTDDQLNTAYEVLKDPARLKALIESEPEKRDLEDKNAEKPEKASA